LKDWEVEKITDELDSLAELLDPAAFSLDIKGYQQRVGSFVAAQGFDLLAVKDVPNHGWAVVRSAKKIFRGESQQPREWGQALRAAQVAATAKTKTGAPPSPKNPKKRWRTRGGRGGGGRDGGAGSGAAGGGSGGGRGAHS
jgi:uncharacterized membrane protein YgcG